MFKFFNSFLYLSQFVLISHHCFLKLLNFYFFLLVFFYEFIQIIKFGNEIVKFIFLFIYSQFDTLFIHTLIFILHNDISRHVFGFNFKLLKFLNNFFFFFNFLRHFQFQFINREILFNQIPQNDFDSAVF